MLFGESLRPGPHCGHVAWAAAASVHLLVGVPKGQPSRQGAQTSSPSNFVLSLLHLPTTGLSPAKPDEPLGGSESPPKRAYLLSP